MGTLYISPSLAKKLKLPEGVAESLPAENIGSYGNRKVFDPVRGKFDSKLEYRRFLMLEAGVAVGAIRNLKRQVEFEIKVEGGDICKYVADFTYETCLPSPGLEPYEWQQARQYNWYKVVEDAKGHRTRVYRLKKKLMKSVLGIDLFEWPPKKKKTFKPRHRIGGKVGNARIKSINNVGG